MCDAQDSLLHMLFESMGFVKPSAYYYYNTDGSDTFTVNLYSTEERTTQPYQQRWMFAYQSSQIWYHGE